MPSSKKFLWGHAFLIDLLFFRNTLYSITIDNQLQYSVWLYSKVFLTEPDQLFWFSSIRMAKNIERCCSFSWYSFRPSNSYTSISYPNNISKIIMMSRVMILHISLYRWRISRVFAGKGNRILWRQDHCIWKTTEIQTSAHALKL